MILVTGGAGFIGARLARELLRQGRRVRILDDFSSGRRDAVPSGAELLEGDVHDAAAKAVDGAELVYHLAALPSVPASVRDPSRSHRTTASGTLAILDAAWRAGARRVVLASSSSVYGDGGGRPLREDAPLRPLSPYGAAKLAAELYGRSYASLGRVEVVALRYFNVYGPGQSSADEVATVIPRFAERLRNGRRLPLFGGGEQTRDFVHVDDVVRATLAAGETPGLSGRAYNVASGTGVSVRELARRLAEALGARAETEERPARAGDPKDVVADVSAAARDLGFAPRVGLDDGLRGLA